MFFEFDSFIDFIKEITRYKSTLRIFETLALDQDTIQIRAISQTQKNTYYFEDIFDAKQAQRIINQLYDLGFVKARSIKMWEG
ncbi:hypothetical protein DRO58_02530 [Candidatus Bathyarchaeota archaeon]|nr:MAG: hypothetical protein DRO58_02530 [Candidatus Bathyarchaeota archaeon]